MIGDLRVKPRGLGAVSCSVANSVECVRAWTTESPSWLPLRARRGRPFQSWV